ncbi:MAG: hypothetical protein Q8P41_07150 [Pseudomonadota bacterium]|nr:hypothetical protein [Pseudomonadota bacterium]
MILALFLACSGPRSAADLPPTDVPPATVAEDAPPVPPVADGTAPGDVVLVDGPTAPSDPKQPGASPLRPAEAYAGCRDRLEGPQAAGECTTDADCTKAGCSSEVCVANANRDEVMTTCEVLACFGAVDSCGCHDGMCSWTLKSEMPPMGRIQLPER